MNKHFGAQGEIANFPFQDLHTTFYNQDGIEIEIKDGILYTGVNDERKLDEAKELALLYISAWSERHKWKVSVDFNHTRKTNVHGEKDHFLEPHNTSKVTDHVQIQTVTHRNCVPPSHNR